MRILGIDPGTQTMGYSVLDLDDGGGMPVCRVWGTLKGGASKDIADRLYLLLSGLRELIAAWEPGQLAIEEPFVSMNRGAKSAIAVGQAQAVALLAATEHGLSIHRYAPAQVKSAVTNYGGGTKAQVQRSVRLLLGLSNEPMPEDASDAIAIALCHAQTVRAAERIGLR